MILRKKTMKQVLHQQYEENIKEIREIGIHYVSLKEYHQNTDAYSYAFAVIPTYKPKLVERLRLSLRRKKNG